MRKPKPPKDVALKASKKVFCGPMAVAAICGISDLYAERLFRRLLKVEKIKGTTFNTCHRVLRLRNKALIELPLVGRTIEDWAAKAYADGGPQNNRWYFISTNKHWLAFRNDHIVDSVIYGIPTIYHKHPEAKNHIKSVHKVVDNIRA
jgi:hypothetical protein